MNDEIYLVVIATEAGAREKFIAAMTHARCLLDNGEQVELRVGPALDPITIKQRKFLHGAVLKQISDQVRIPLFDSKGQLTGKTELWPVDQWKLVYNERFLFHWEMRRGEVVDKKTGVRRVAKKRTPHKVYVSSESLGPKKYAIWTDQIIDDAIVQYGVTFEFEPSEREGARYMAKPRHRSPH